MSIAKADSCDSLEFCADEEDLYDTRSQAARIAESCDVRTASLKPKRVMNPREVLKLIWLIAIRYTTAGLGDPKSGVGICPLDQHSLPVQDFSVVG